MADMGLLQFLHLFLLLLAVTLLLIMLYSMANYQIMFDSNNSSFLCSLIDYRELPHIFPPVSKATLFYSKKEIPVTMRFLVWVMLPILD